VAYACVLPVCQDTAGEERYRGLSQFYCRNAGAAILAFDVTSEDSFHSLRSLKL
jgi:Ras-related protein Rab-20